MPLPKAGEKQASYVSRYVASKRAQKDFPNQKQRLAVAYSEYARAHGKKSA
jgi:hypothetical protein